MTRNKTTIFRRFDDVHVRLLLHLQDEISSLEKQLLDLDRDLDLDLQTDTKQGDRIGAKASVMRELRKAMAEYGTFIPTIYNLHSLTLTCLSTLLTKHL